MSALGFDKAVEVVKEMNSEERAYYKGIREALFWNAENGKKQRIPWDTYIPGVGEFNLNPLKFWAILVEHATDDGGWMWYWEWEIIDRELMIELRCSESPQGLGDWNELHEYDPPDSWFEIWSFSEFIECYDVMKEGENK